MTQHPPTRSHEGICRWLYSVYGMILTMVLIGGITRLTGSGLSMVEWRPLMGLLPPLSEGEWLRVFDLYKESPQFQQVNSWMDLAAFKSIFFWEYLHRLWGRLIGLVFALPLIYLWLRGALTPRWKKRSLIALLLGGSQGLMGWYMVKSGLVDEPSVSHLRLAAHLSLAFTVGMWVLWMILDLRAGSGPWRRVNWRLSLFSLLLIPQIVYGAFMAGKKAGLLYGSFPDYQGAWIPSGLGAAVGVEGIFGSAVAIHFIHRSLAWLLLLAFAFLCWSLRDVAERAVARWRNGLIGLFALQFALGVITVIYRVPTWAAAAHQLVAFLLLSATVGLWHQLGRAPQSGAHASN